jgi:hypothetical protein
MLSTIFIPIIFLAVSLVIIGVIKLLEICFPRVNQVVNDIIGNLFIVSILFLLSLILGLLDIVPSARFFLGYTIGLLG